MTNREARAVLWAVFYYLIGALVGAVWYSIFT